MNETRPPESLARTAASSTGARLASRLRQGGTTLIELMVSLVIGSILMVAVLGLMAGFEGQRRTIGSVSGLDQTSGVAMFKLDQWIRSAGAGFEQAWSYAYGCELLAAKSSTQILPATGTLPSPFANLGLPTGGLFRLAPLLIVPGGTMPGVSGQASDALVIMASGAGSADLPTMFNGPAQNGQLTLVDSVAYAPNDLVLIADQQPTSAGGPSPCTVSQVSGSWVAPTSAQPSVSALSLAGSWYASAVAGVALTDYSSTAVAMELGNVAGASHPPTFIVVGVGDNDTLYSDDLLDTTGTPLQAVADNVFELHARYGVDTDGDGKVDTWIDPAADKAGSYALANLMSGSAAASTLLQSIKAVRVGLIVRTSLPERSASAVVEAPSVTLFPDLGTLAYTRTFSAAEQVYRYRTVEATIPVRNNFF